MNVLAEKSERKTGRKAQGVRDRRGVVIERNMNRVLPVN